MYKEDVMRKIKKMFVLVLTVLLLAAWASVSILTVSAAEEDQLSMKKEAAVKLCVTSHDKDMDSQVDEVFGRAAYFIIVDIETMEAEIIKNTAAKEKRRASIVAAKVISDKGADALLTGKVGAKGLTALSEAGIKVYQGASELDSVKDAIEKFIKGDYKETPIS